MRWGNADNGYMSFNGDIAEMIAFTRTLSDAEIRAVENYLGQKWLGQTFHADGLDGATRAANVLAPTGGLKIRAGATLDLNGIDQTVASLSGQGTIVNTGARPARLTVTGSWSFRGTIGAGVTVRAPGDVEGATADVFVEKDGKIEVSGGTLSVKTFNPAPVTDGLTIWLDASKSETLALDANNAVTGWVSRLPATTRFHWDATTKIKNANLPPPTNAPTAWLDAKPCVWIPAGGTISNVGTLTLDGELYVPVTDGKVDALKIDGNLTIEESASVFVDGFATIPRTHRQKALEATGTVTGSLDKTNLTRRYSWEPATGPIWYLGYKNGLLLILR